MYVMCILKALHEININFVFYYNTTKSGIRFPANPTPRKICITNIVRELFGKKRKKNRNQHYLILIALRFLKSFYDTMTNTYLCIYILYTCTARILRVYKPIPVIF
jgi:hypothetical protein